MKDKKQRIQTTNMPRSQQLIDHYAVLKGERTNFESYWQTLHDYYYIEANDVNKSYYPGTELSVDYLYDSTTIEAGDVLASGFMNYLTPATAKWARLRHRDPHLQDNKVVSAYLEDVMDQVHYTLHRSNFYDQMFSSYKSSGIYGTSIMLEEEDVDDDVRFYNLPVKNVCLVEDGRGRVTAYYIEFEYTAEQAAGKFGAENLSDTMKEELTSEKKQTKKHPFILYIGKRHAREVQKSNDKNLPIEAIWVDASAKITVMESGYNEFPAFAHRFDKRPFIPWGFSPAMKALPFARILNAVAKTNLRAMMKQTDPPIAVPDNAFVMPFNANPRAVNYYNKNNMANSQDNFSFGNFGDPNTGMAAIEFYSGKVKSLMFSDVFLAFDNLTKQMNNPEVAERINEKMTMLGPAVGRYISEMLNPTIIRTIGILYRKGKLPRPPDELIDNPNYEIDSISQLAQIQRRSEFQSLMSGISVVGNLSPMFPSVLDKLDSDRVVDEAWSILGAPTKALVDDSALKEKREAQAQANAQQAAMETATQQAGAMKEASGADLNVAKAGEANRK